VSHQLSIATTHWRTQYPDKNWWCHEGCGKAARRCKQETQRSAWHDRNSLWY
jgi:hypothetical protein